MCGRQDKTLVIGLGEALWDLLPAGPQLGGAPANFACHARALGARTQVITRVGNDDHGREIIRRFEAMGIDGAMVQMDEESPTGTVTVALSGNGIPAYTIHENIAWDRIAATPEALAAVRAADAVCFGSLAQRSEASRAAIQRLVAATPADALRIFDINLRQHFYGREIIGSSLQLANVLKLNDSELPVLAQMFGVEGSPGNKSKDWRGTSACASWPSRAGPKEACCSRAAAGRNSRPARSKSRTPWVRGMLSPRRFVSDCFAPWIWT